MGKANRDRVHAFQEAERARGFAPPTYEELKRARVIIDLGPKPEGPLPPNALVSPRPVQLPPRLRAMRELMPRVELIGPSACLDVKVGYDHSEPRKIPRDPSDNARQVH